MLRLIIINLKRTTIEYLMISTLLYWPPSSPPMHPILVQYILPDNQNHKALRPALARLYWPAAPTLPHSPILSGSITRSIYLSISPSASDIPYLLLIQLRYLISFLHTYKPCLGTTLLGCGGANIGNDSGRYSSHYTGDKKRPPSRYILYTLNRPRLPGFL